MTHIQRWDNLAEWLASFIRITICENNQHIWFIWSVTAVFPPKEIFSCKFQGSICSCSALNVRQTFRFGLNGFNRLGIGKSRAIESKNNSSNMSCNHWSSLKTKRISPKTVFRYLNLIRMFTIHQALKTVRISKHWSLPKILLCSSYFMRCLEMLSNTVFRVWYIT